MAQQCARVVQRVNTAKEEGGGTLGELVTRVRTRVYSDEGSVISVMTECPGDTLSCRGQYIGQCCQLYTVLSSLVIPLHNSGPCWKYLPGPDPVSAEGPGGDNVTRM